MIAETVAIVAHDAGGAEILSSHVRRLGSAERSRFLFVLQGPASRIFPLKLGPIAQVPLDEAVRLSSSVLCGSGWQSELELQAIGLARGLHKVSTVFLDHWVNYRERFTREGRIVLPDKIWVGDTLALERVKTALPEVMVNLVENPYFMDVRDEFSKSVLRAPATDGLSVLFVCEPIREHALHQYGNERHWGYTEEEALRYFLDHLSVLPQPVARIIVRPHPAEPQDKYTAVMREYGLPLQLSDGRDLIEDVAASHWVVGCNSMAMVIGLLAGREVVCCIPPGGSPCQLPQSGIRHLQSLVQSGAHDT
jgi:hypothetical protein